MTAARLAVFCDLREEGWPSMDLMGDMLLSTLRARHAGALAATRVCPPLRRRVTRLPLLGRARRAGTLDRLVNRYWDYPRLARGHVAHHDLFHVVDHSYAHLVHELPAGRTGVFCHDLDAFGCLLGASPRWRAMRRLARRTLAGMQKAAVVFHLTEEVGRQIVRHGLIDPARLVHAAPGVAAEFTPAAAEADGAVAPGPFLLHVGSCIPRKRIDVLLGVFAEARRRFPELRLVQVGGRWEAGQRREIERRGLAGAVAQVAGVGRAVIAAHYRRAALVLVPSEAEGFGLPLAEALACGAAVVASDIPVLREVGGAAAVYGPVGEVGAWAEVVCGLLGGGRAAPGREARLAQAARFTWERHGDIVAGAYGRLSGA